MTGHPRQTAIFPAPMLHYSIFWAVVFLAHLAVIVRAIMVEGRDPYARLAWLMALICVPIAGIVAYAMFGEPWIAARFRRKANRVYVHLENLPVVTEHYASPDSLPARFVAPFRTCEKLSQSQATERNDFVLAPDANAAIAMMVADIAGAARTVHLSFYIWLDDHNGLKMVEAIVAAARRGVTCRITADAIGSRPLIRSPHWQKMRDAGAQMCASLSPPTGFNSITSIRLDLRNHRKIVVIDNCISYCGSQNCADPEFLVKAHYAPWVDILVRVTGPIAVQNQLIFASAWTVETGEDLTACVSRDVAATTTGDVLAVAFGTGPLSAKGAMSEAFAGVMYAAQDELTISTPYFVPDPPLLAAIIACARRGVKTSLIVPAANDSRIVGAISRSLYPRLISGGVDVFEYHGGLLHAKTLVADRALSLIGSSNMDRRSLELNFENNVLLYSARFTQQIVERQQSYLAASTRVTPADIHNRTFIRRFGQNAMTMASAIY